MRSRRNIHRIRRRNAGVSLIEFALCAMLFFLLYFGVMSWAWTFFQHQTITWRVSDAARWAAANRADDLTTIRNIIMCGTTAACGTNDTPFYSIGNIDIEHFSRSDQVDSTSGPGNSTFPPVTRYFIRVTVQGYQIRHFIPGFSGVATGQPVSSIQPMECQQPTGNCWDWN